MAGRTTAATLLQCWRRDRSGTLANSIRMKASCGGLHRTQNAIASARVSVARERTLCAPCKVSATVSMVKASALPSALTTARPNSAGAAGERIKLIEGDWNGRCVEAVFYNIYRHNTCEMIC